MQWMIDKERPICPQINEQIAARIALGEFKPQERLASVRDVAVAAGVNPNTVQKAFESLEAEGLIYSVRGSGWFVSDAVGTAQQKLQKLAEEKISALFQSLKTLGYSREQVTALVNAQGAQAHGENIEEEAK
ncbi:MAG: GntR family transcriptional regulator [Lachnospiraceae bacterium]|nr:GntR family transcriptional regulator [Lachnospiraceae bacterium]